MNKNTKIVMITMFKNEAKTILRMLKSCYKYVDYFIFQDNGSTDGTPQLVSEFCNEHGLNGFIYQVEEGWVSFGWNRDHLLQTCLKADHGCDWILKMDCDEYLEVDDDFDWSLFDDTSIQSFHVAAKAPGITYYRAWIWNAKLPWKFNHDLAHETITLEMDGIGENFQRVNLPLSFRQIGTNDGESYTVPTKYVSDALKLEEKLIRENTLLTDTYHFWYIGKSYFDAFKCETFPLKESQQKEYARRCIYYFWEYVNHTHNYGETGTPNRIDEFAYFAMYCIANTYKYLGDIEQAIEFFNKSGPFCPRRNEHLVRLCEICGEQGDYLTMFGMVNYLLTEERKNPFPEFMFLIDSACYYDTGNYLEHLKDVAFANMPKVS
jgi:glycosyltransferase involved in cell wall biosynthesis